MFGMPSLQTIMTIAVAPLLIAFAIVNYKENIYSVGTWIAVFIADILVLSGYFPFIYETWKSDNPQMPHKQMPINDEQPLYADYENLPEIKSGGKPLYSQNMPGLKMDCVRRFNRTLLEQKAGKLEIRMDETFWLKRLAGAEDSNWVKAGGIGRADFVDMLERGIRWGAYKKIGGQGKRVPDDWSKIRQLSNGSPLPQ